MIEIPSDPVQDIIDFVHRWGRKWVLMLLDEDLIISGGMKSQPNAIEAEGIGYESLPKEAIFLRSAAQYRSSLRNGKRMMVLYFIDASKHLRRATRSASNR